jgi:hydroxypyruvate isomerase
MCDHITWAVCICEEVARPEVKLLFDIYHMQIMDGDLIETIRTHSDWLHHYHTGDIPGRHEIDASQEVNYPAVMRAMLDTGFTGFVAHEYVPTISPELSLKQAFDLCNV